MVFLENEQPVGYLGERQMGLQVGQDTKFGGAERRATGQGGVRGEGGRLSKVGHLRDDDPQIGSVPQDVVDLVQKMSCRGPVGQ